MARGVGISSRDEQAVFNGANVAMVETDAGWELLQFREVELVDVETYKLTGLLRGQQGSEVATMASAPAGSRIVFLTGAEQRLAIAGWERGLELQWSVGRESAGDLAVWKGVFAHDALAERAWSPTHLRAAWAGADVTLMWIRRARQNGDPWLAGEPAHEWPEGYRVRVSGGVSVREWDVADAFAGYLASDQAAVFPAGGSALIKVAQLGATGEPGGWSRLELTIPAS